MTRRVIVAAAAYLAVAGLAACGGAGRHGGGSHGSTAFLAFAKCMRADGVPNFPDPGGSSGGGLSVQLAPTGGPGQTMTVNGVPVSAPAFHSAMQHCQPKLPGGGSPSPGQLAKLRARSLAMARCMRAHGLPNFPDPQFTRIGGALRIRLFLSNTDTNAPAFQAAQRVCFHGILKAPPTPQTGAGG